MRIGIDLGGTNVRLGVVEEGMIIKKVVESSKSDLPEKEILDHLKGLIHRLITPAVESIGIGVPSVVNSENGIVYNVANIPSWKEVHLKAILEAEFNVPVVVNNDCNCFALGEYMFGSGAAYKNMVCIALGTGVGAGIIIDGKLYNGNNTGAGEIGSLPYLNSDYEHYCSSLFFSKERGITAKEAFEKSCNGDTDALRLWDEVGSHFGNLLNAVLFAYDPEAIILGGSISKAFCFFSGKMYENLRSFPYPETIERLKIILSEKEDVSLLGASAL